MAALADLDIPVYLWCDWDNVIMHLPGMFTSWKALTHNPGARNLSELDSQEGSSGTLPPPVLTQAAERSDAGRRRRRACWTAGGA